MERTALHRKLKLPGITEMREEQGGGRRGKVAALKIKLITRIH